jgi:RimJ/RimL family protein N-acetyltransferase
MVEWAFTVPRVVRIEMAVSSGQGNIPTMRRLYESCGFVLEGTLFTRNHPKYNEALLGVQAA